MVCFLDGAQHCHKPRWFFRLTQAKWDFALAQRIWETVLRAPQTQLWNRSTQSGGVVADSQSAVVGISTDSLENLSSLLMAGASEETPFDATLTSVHV